MAFVALTVLFILSRFFHFLCLQFSCLDLPAAARMRAALKFLTPPLFAAPSHYDGALF